MNEIIKSKYEVTKILKKYLFKKIILKKCSAFTMLLFKNKSYLWKVLGFLIKGSAKFHSTSIFYNFSLLHY